MKILKYITLIGLTVYGQSIFAMEQIEKAVVIQKMSLRDLAKYRAKMNELAEGMPNARQRAKFRDAYMEQIKLALAEKAAESLAMSSLPTKGATEIKQYIKLKLTQQFPEYSKSQSSPEFTYYIILADAATPSPNAARKKLFVDAWGAMQSIIESAPVQDRLGIAKELDTQAQTLAEALFGNSPELSDKFKDTYLPWFNFISTKLKELEIKAFLNEIRTLRDSEYNNNLSWLHRARFTQEKIAVLKKKMRALKEEIAALSDSTNFFGSSKDPVKQAKLEAQLKSLTDTVADYACEGLRGYNNKYLVPIEAVHQQEFQKLSDELILDSNGTKIEATDNYKPIDK